MQNLSESPPRAPPIKYFAPLGIHWANEKAAARGGTTFDLPTDPKTIGPWILDKCVGKGASGCVKIVGLAGSPLSKYLASSLFFAGYQY